MAFAGDIAYNTSAAEWVSQAAGHCAPSRWSDPNSLAARGGKRWAFDAVRDTDGFCAPIAVTELLKLGWALQAKRQPATVQRQRSHSGHNSHWGRCQGPRRCRSSRSEQLQQHSQCRQPHSAVDTQGLTSVAAPL